MWWLIVMNSWTTVECPTTSEAPDVTLSSNEPPTKIGSRCAVKSYQDLPPFAQSENCKGDIFLNTMVRPLSCTMKSWCKRRCQRHDIIKNTWYQCMSRWNHDMEWIHRLCHSCTWHDGGGDTFVRNIQVEPLLWVYDGRSCKWEWSFSSSCSVQLMLQWWNLPGRWTKRKPLLQLEPEKSAIGKRFIFCHSTRLNSVIIDTHTVTPLFQTPPMHASPVLHFGMLDCTFIFVCLHSCVHVHLWWSYDTYYLQFRMSLTSVTCFIFPEHAESYITIVIVPS